jgi:hypothetical protein
VIFIKKKRDSDFNITGNKWEARESISRERKIKIGRIEETKHERINNPSIDYTGEITPQ